MSLTMEQVVTQLQQEIFALRAQVAAESGLADAVRAINYLTTAQVRKDTPSLIECEWPGSSEGILWQRGGFQTVVEEDEGILRWRNPGV